MNFKNGGSNLADMILNADQNLNAGKSNSMTSLDNDFKGFTVASSEPCKGLSRAELYEVIKSNWNAPVVDVYSAVENLLSAKYKILCILTDSTKQEIKVAIAKIKEKWGACNRTESRFLERNCSWLNAVIPVEIPDLQTNSQKGRPSTDFHTASERTKRRKTQELREQRSTTELAYATQMKLRAEGNSDGASILKNVVSSSPTKVKNYRRSFDSPTQNIVFTADEALSLFIELQLSKYRYQQLRNACMQKKDKIFPSYNQIRMAKKNCYPLCQLEMSETKAEIKIQPLLDHTTFRILQTQTDVVKLMQPKELQNLTLICKSGCDGSSGHSMYKQKFTDQDASDESIFFTSIVPLQLQNVNESTGQVTIVWKNPRPSSSRYCRPIKIEYVRESVEVINSVVTDVKSQCGALQPYHIAIAGKSVKVNYSVAFCMIDGKVCNAMASNTSTQRCYLCDATSKEFNNIDAIVMRPIIEKNLEFGLSSLHAWIRCFECLLHLSYKLGIKKWQSRGAEDQKLVGDRKKIIQESFKKEMGLIVDKPKPGYGSSNDGNTARRFFENSKVSAAITGIDEDLIHRFHIMLQAISSGYTINIQAFEGFNLVTARKFVELYDWYYMPPTVHKLLIHGSQITSHSLLPIGQMSEDAQEACNKFFKHFREDYTRKSSRTNTMQDIFNRFLVISDPYISSCRQLPVKPLKSLSSEVIELLLPPDVTQTNILKNLQYDGLECSTSASEDTDASESMPSDDMADFFL